MHNWHQKLVSLNTISSSRYCHIFHCLTSMYKFRANLFKIDLTSNKMHAEVDKSPPGPKRYKNT